MREYVCQGDYHRFKPGPRLGWLTRWSGRWLWREKHAPADMAESCVCRVCGQTGRYEEVRKVVAVLDSKGRSYPHQQGDILRVNWLDRKEGFDFDRVEVVAATDDDVDAFVRQTRFESDPRLQRRLPNMECVVNAECRFQRANTLTILRQNFGSVSQD